MSPAGRPMVLTVHGYKSCSHRGCWRPVSDFKPRKGANGVLLESWCKPCAYRYSKLTKRAQNGYLGYLPAGPLRDALRNSPTRVGLIAEHANTTTRTVRRIRAGRQDNVRYLTAERLAEAVGRSLWELYPDEAPW